MGYPPPPCASPALPADVGTYIKSAPSPTAPNTTQLQAARKLTAKFREPDPMAIAAAAGNAPGKKEKKAMEAKEQAKVATGGKADGGEEGAA